MNFGDGVWQMLPATALFVMVLAIYLLVLYKSYIVNRDTNYVLMENVKMNTPRFIQLKKWGQDDVLAINPEHISVMTEEWFPGPEGPGTTFNGTMVTLISGICYRVEEKFYEIEIKIEMVADDSQRS